MAKDLLLATLDDSVMQNYNNDLNAVITQLNHYIPQYYKFINDIIAVQFQYNVIIVEEMGNLSVDVPANMPEVLEQEVVKKVRILDSLCAQRSIDIESELTKGKSIENLMKQANPNYTSQIAGQIAEYARLRGAFK